ncbi:MAG: hypothetical protein II953_07740 [Clostridia bacterium]|nr:hypothetical protein [Clostridia bacterium]MBQ5356218.1 hypothetical protein [Clostridia bacterium]
MLINNNRSRSRRIALCGIFAALCLVFLGFGGLTLLDLSILVVCALMTMLLVVEAGVRMTWIYAAATSVLALLLLPSKLYAVEYALFAAVYPILKLYMEKLPAIAAYPVKISCLDSMLLLCLVLAQKVFMAGEDYFSLSWITVGVGTLFFILFDVTLSLCISLYLVKLRKKLGIGRRR